MSEYGRVRRPDPCVMELVSKLAREPWTDRPTCVHPTLSAAARAVHDHSSSAGRRALVPLAPKFIDTARPGLDVSARVVALCVSTALTTGELTSDETVRMRRAHETALHLLTGQGAARWWLPLLDRFGWSEPFYRTFVATEQVAEAVAVTARHANGDRDRKLRNLLKQCLSAHGALRPGAPTPS
ncbi:hypothetical protein HPO96_04880 [Kribbella sandramycini]|uniref:Uncharacterized protein n=1 Tax=Kribbella sandramycini TaxID=60450 RepID=A0A7Y4NYW7_9ACTN|nr:hypothetical protein [Kribbella sandramycini]MBB6567830.1 hypothetical protein [Kribbella sandramycini]NOL39575.1 hypothetical protein [Kribbella sandramycini]